MKGAAAPPLLDPALHNPGRQLLTALRIGDQRAISLFTSAASACGPRRSLPGISLPSSRSRLRVASSSSALSSAADNLSRIDLGVPFGANSAFQADTWKSGNPPSFEV